MGEQGRVVGVGAGGVVRLALGVIGLGALTACAAAQAVPVGAPPGTGKAGPTPAVERSATPAETAAAGIAEMLLVDNDRPAPEHLEGMFRDIAAEVDRLGKTGEAGKAQKLAAELKRCRSLLEAPSTTARGDEPEVHVVALRRGKAAPPGVLQGAERFTRTYAEVKVTFTARPVVLVLMGEEPILWQVKPAEGVRLHAVILMGRERQTLGSLPQDPIVFQRFTTRGGGGLVVLSSSGPAFAVLNDDLLEFAGRPITVLLGQSEYPGEPIVVGPENREWDRQRAFRQTLVETWLLHEEAMEPQRARQFAGVADLRFPAVWLCQSGGRQGAASGEFTVAGPIIASLRNLPHPELRRMAIDAKEDLQFGLNHNNELRLVDPKSEELPSVQGPPGTDRTRFSAMALDTKRRRLVLAPERDKTPLWALDLGRSEWLVLGDPGYRLTALAYSPGEDAFYAATRIDLKAARAGPPLDGERSSPTHVLLKIDGSGKPLREVNLSKRVAFREEGGPTQLVCAGGRLVLITPLQQRRQGQSLCRLYVIEPDSGTVVYEGLSEPHNGLLPHRPKPAVGVPVGGPLSRLVRAFAQAAKAEEAVRAAGQRELAARLARQIALLRERLAGNYAVDKDAPPELHLVGFYAAKGAVVEVTEKSRPVVLALCAYDPSKWTVSVAAGVRLKRVIVAGYHRQSVEGVPAGVPVEIHTHEDQTGGFFTSRRDDAEFPGAARQLRELTGLQIATFQGDYEYRGIPVRIGPESGEWRAQDILHGLEQVTQEARGVTEADRWAALERLRFRAICYRRATHPMPPLRPGEEQRPTLFDAAAEFTPRGPIVPTFDPIPGEVDRIVLDPRGPAYYGIRGSDVSRLDAQTGAWTPIVKDAGIEVGHNSPIAFDTRRRRLLATKTTSDGRLYAYDVDRSAWSVLARPFPGAAALAYAEDEDVLYALESSMGERSRPSIYRYSPEGVPLGHISPTDRHFMERASSIREFRGTRDQLACPEGHLAVLTYGPGDEPNSAEMIGRIYVLSRTTGEVVHSGRTRPQPGFKDYSAEQLEGLWKELAARDAATAEKASWGLAAGGQAAVDFLDKRLLPLRPVDPARVAKLIQQLGDDQFAVRQQAYRDLAELGSTIEPLLEEAMNQAKSAEIQASLRRLLQSWKTAQPPSAAEMREVRAVKVLGLVGGPKAGAVLNRLASEPAGGVRAREAKAALKALETESPW